MSEVAWLIVTKLGIRFMKLGQTFGASSEKLAVRKNITLSARFLTTSRLDGEYLWNATKRYRQLEQ